MNPIGRKHTTYTIEQLREYSKLSAKEILDWLEEIMLFLDEAMSPQAKEIWQKFRSGELKYPHSEK